MAGVKKFKCHFEVYHNQKILREILMRLGDLIRVYSIIRYALCNDHKQNNPCSIRTDDGWRYTEYIYMKVTFCLEIHNIIL